jgi:alkylated DNA repair dioxygenase AlkB
VNPTDAFNTLWTELPWTRHDKVPRREFYFNEFKEPYSYGKPEFARTYLPTLEWHPLVREIQVKLESFLTELLGGNMRMEVCFLNGYEDGHDQLGWHADDSPEMDDDRPIITISLGAEREIWFRKNEIEAAKAFLQATSRPWDPASASDDQKTIYRAIREPEVLLLGNGSLAIMLPGMQDTHEHRIPKSSLHKCGPRISLTFRGYKAP